MLWYTSALTQRWASAQRWFRKKNTKGCFYTQMLLHRGFQQRDAFTHRCFRKQILLHRDYFEKNKLDAGTFSHRCLYTDMLLHTVVFTQCCHVQVLLRRDSFRRKYFYTNILWHTLTDLLHTNTFARWCFLDTSAVSHMHTHACSLNRDVFKHACFCTEICSHKDTFFCTEMLAHTQIILRWGTVRANAITNRGASTKEAFTRGTFTYGGFYTDILLHDIRRQTPKNSANRCQTKISPPLWMM